MRFDNVGDYNSFTPQLQKATTQLQQLVCERIPQIPIRPLKLAKSIHHVFARHHCRSMLNFGRSRGYLFIAPKDSSTARGKMRSNPNSFSTLTTGRRFRPLGNLGVGTLSNKRLGLDRHELGH